MGEDKFKELKGSALTIIIFGIILTIITSFAVMYAGYWVDIDRTCGDNQYTLYGGTTLAASSYILSNETDSALQELDLFDAEDLTYQFCFTSNSTNAHEVHVIDHNGTVRGKGYKLAGVKNTCVDASLSPGKQYLGIRCDTCTSSNNMTLYDELAGKNTIIAYNYDGALTVQSSRVLDYTVNARESCKLYIARFLWIWAFFMFLLMLALLIIIGYNQLKEMIIDDWGRIMQ